MLILSILLFLPIPTSFTPLPLSSSRPVLCGEDEIRVGCPVICVTSANEWANGWECFYGFDRGFAMATFNYFEINYIPGYPPVGNGDGGMLNRDLKDRLFRECYTVCLCLCSSVFVGLSLYVFLCHIQRFRDQVHPWLFSSGRLGHTEILRLGASRV